MRNFKLNSANGNAILVLCAGALLAQLMVTPTSGQAGRQSTGTKTRNGAADQQPQVAPFFSIKDGKASARRIQQQQQDGGSLSTTQNPSSAFAVSEQATVTTQAANWRQSGSGSPFTTTATSTSGGASSSSQGGVADNSAANDDQRLFSQVQQQKQGSTDETGDQQNEIVQQRTPASQFGGSNDAGSSPESSSTAGQQQSTSTLQPALDQQADQFQSTFTTGTPGTGNDATTTSRLVMQPLGQQQQQQEFTGSSVSTPSSLSMSLDGMIVNSRPRAPIGSSTANLDGQQSISTGSGRKGAGSKSSRVNSVSRIGELIPSTLLDSTQQRGAPQQQQQQEGPGAKSRRVPFAGNQFSSPATKGQRTKPNASNNQMGPTNAISQQFKPQQQTQFVPSQKQQQQDIVSGLEFDAMGNQRQVSMGVDQMNQIFRQQQQQPAINQALRQQVQQQAIDAQGFGEEPAQLMRFATSQQQSNGANKPLDSSELDMMRNLLANGGVSELRSPQSTGSSNPNDMVMSVMSSADGKERRLVMIARNTLDTLQRFAQTNAPTTRNQQLTTKTRQSTRGGNLQNQQSVSRNGRPSVGSETFSSNGQSTRTQSSFQPKQQTITGSRLSQQQQQQLDLQQEVQLQTTTPSPAAAFTGGSSSLPTTTTQQPLIISTTTTQTLPIEMRQTISQESVSSGSSSLSQPEAPLGGNSSLTKGNGSSGDNTFREVPVSSSPETTSTAAEQQQQQPKQSISIGAGRKQQATKGAKSSRTNGDNQTQRSSASKQQKSGSAATNGKKRTNQSGKQQSQAASSNASSKQQKQTVTKSQGTKSAKKQQQQQAAGQGQKQQVNRKQTSSAAPVTRVTTNGQQPTGAMLSRVFEQQSSTSSSDIQLAGQQQAGRRVNSGATDDEVGATEGSMSLASGSRTSTGATGQDQVAADGQTQRGTSTASGTTANDNGTTTTTTTSISRLPTAQQTVRDSSSTSSDAQPAGVFDMSQLDKKLDEIERNQENGGSESLGTAGGDSLSDLRATLPGEPRVDYPIYGAPPKTSFDCMSQSCPGGYYADMETQCQVFHICQNDGRFDTFLCPNGTIFSQQHFVCVWWWQVDCQQSAAFYKLNDGIYCNSMFSASGSATAVAAPTGGRATSTSSSSSSSLSATDSSPQNEFNESTGSVASTQGSEAAGSSSTAASSSLPEVGASSDSTTSSSLAQGSQSALATTSETSPVEGSTADGSINRQQQQSNGNENSEADLSQQHEITIR